MPFKTSIFLVVLLFVMSTFAQTENRPRVREIGLKIGILPTGKLNSITDVGGVLVGHSTIIQGDNIRTGVTAVLAHNGNLFREKVPAAVFVGNGFGKLMGSTQVSELGEIETPILLTSTLAVPRVADFLIDYMLALPGNESVQSINPLVAETNDGFLNNIRGRQITQTDVFNALKNAGITVEEGSVGAGTGTVAFGFKGGIGTASRQVPASLGGYTVGVLVQSNFGGVLSIDGVPVGVELGKYYLKDAVESAHKSVSEFPSNDLNDWADGSIIIVIATDAPIDARQLKRMGLRAMSGLARTGSAMTNGSGDYAIAFSTASEVRIKPLENGQTTRNLSLLSNDGMSPLFLATIEATEEAILNSLFRATTMKGREGRTIEALPIDKTLAILQKYNKIK
jgi:D-aminopeptidase